MKIESIQAFLAVAKLKNFTRAAEKLYVTQPALSRAIAGLEKELGGNLFERSTRSVELTELGEICRAPMEKILRGYEELMDGVDGVRRSALCGTLRIGYNPISGQPRYLVEALSVLSRRYEKISVELQCAYAPALLEAVASGSIDCCFISDAYLKQEEGFSVFPIHSINLFAMVPQQNAFAAHAELRLAELENEPVVMIQRKRAPELYDTTMAAFHEAGIAPHIIKEVSSVEELSVMVRACNAIALMTSSEAMFQQNDLKIFPLRDVPPRAVRVLAWKTENRNPCIGVLREILTALPPAVVARESGGTFGIG